MSRFADKVAVVTGGASGIGLATARRFAAEGAKVVLGDVQDGAAVAEELGGAFVATDMTDPDAVEALVAAAVERFGRVDVLLNNAGIGVFGPVAQMELEQHKRVVDVNLNGVFYGLQAAIRAMMNNDGPARGAIVNVASVAGLSGSPGLASYGATKAAVVMLTKNAALEYAQFGIRVNAVCPGFIRTPMATSAFADEDEMVEKAAKAHPLGRVGEPDDVAKLIAFLASEDAGFITGAAVPIDGGMTAGFRAPRAS